ncbi:MAG: SOS response-associated peptidase [Armatimonadetes bacterium]|nr:SOS response-associated peptidase [Armatimonadota bacterium]
MCGRFTQHHDAGQVALRFAVDEANATVAPRYNVAPQQYVPVVYAPESLRLLEDFRWGLVPSWAKDAAIGQKMINARSETVSEKPSFRAALTRRRCLIPADGFYEWEKHEDGSRHPVHFRLTGGDTFAFAGLWEEWHDPASESPLRTCTIITTTANETVGRVHDRMPVILAPDAETLWLDAEMRDKDVLRSLLVPYPDGSMEAFAVSRRVNSPANEGADLLAPIS